MSTGGNNPIRRLAEAVEAFRLRRDSPDPNESDESFLVRHELLRDLLEPMLKQSVVAAVDRREDAPSLSQRQPAPVRVEPPSPNSVGPYELVELVGRGGMGVVYLAEQKTPIQRRVALKLIRPGLDTQEFTRRFESERQALALMDHPNIARVYDAGATAEGQPYFAMEFVPGVPITEFCDHNRLDMRERLSLFIPICEAIQHAHQKGIIHRDIKPSNVLVAEQDGKPSPKVIDFGAAKLIERTIEQGTQWTLPGQAIGTPEYMSPEQVNPSAPDVDTRTDVYSLGVLLYELLVGALPFTAGIAGIGAAASPEEIRRRIREDEPRRPSTQVTVLGTAGDAAAKSRRTDRRSLAKQLRGDLDWITMTAMEKDRERRYAAASELAADISRYLADEPVLAGPPNPSYRLRKLVRRHRALVSGAVAVAAALLMGTIVSSVLWVRAEGKAKEALDSKAEAVAETNRTRGISEFLTRVLQAPDPLRGNRNVTVAEVLDRAASEIDAKFASEPAIAATIQYTIGVADANLGRFDAARPLLEAAAATRERVLGVDRRETLEAMHQLASVLHDLSQLEAAESLYRRTLEVESRVLDRDDPLALGTAGNFALVLQDQGKLAEAEALLTDIAERHSRRMGAENRESLAARSNLGQLLFDRGKYVEARRTLEEAWAGLRRTAGEEHPDTLAAGANLGAALLKLGELESAENLLRSIRETEKRVLGEDHPTTLRTMNALATVISQRGRAAEAEPLQREVLEKRRRLLGDDHPDTLTALHNVAEAMRALGKASDAEPLCRQALEGRRRRLGEDHADALATGGLLARILMEEGKRDDSEALFRHVLEGQTRALGEDHPDTLLTANNFAVLLRAEEKLDEAEALRRRTLAAQERVLGADNPNTLASKANLAAILLSRGRLAEAEELARSTVESQWRVLGPDHSARIASIKVWVAALQRQRKFPEAEAALREIFESRVRTAGEDGPATLEATTALASWLYEEEKFADAEPLARHVLEVRRRVLGSGHKDTLAATHNLVLPLLSQSKLDEAETLLHEVIEAAGTGTPDAAAWLPVFHGQLGRCLLEKRKYEEAEAELVPAYEALQASRGDANPQTVAVLKAIVDLYDAWQKPEKAAEYRERLPATGK